MKTSIQKGAFFFSISTVLFLVSGYLVNILLGRMLGPAEYGIYGLLMTIVSLINIIQTNGITQSVSKFLSENKYSTDALLKSGLTIQLIFNLFFFCIFFFFSDYIASLLQDNHLSSYIKLIAFIFPVFSLYGLYTDYLNGLHYFRKQAVMSIIYSVLKTVLMLLFAFFFKIYGAFIGLMLALFISTMYGFKLPNWNVKLFPIRKILFFSLPIVGVAIFSNLLFSVDIFFLKIFANSKESVGFYAASQNISRLIFYAISPLLLVLFPNISYAVSSNNHKYSKKLIEKSFRIVLIFLLPVVIIISSYSKQIVEIIFSARFLPASQSLSILIFGVAFFTLFTLHTYILNASGKSFHSSLIGFISLIATSVCCLFLVPKYQLDGAAIAMSIGSGLAFTLSSIYIYRIFRVFINPIRLFKIITASIILLIFTRIVVVPIVFMPVLCIILVVVYVLLLALVFREISKADFQEIHSLLPSKIAKMRLIRSFSRRTDEINV